jgi:transcription elongation factor SPT6
LAGAAPEDVVEEEEMEEEDEEEMGEEDEMADFIVDEEEVDEHGQPSRYTAIQYFDFFDYPGLLHGLLR